MSKRHQSEAAHERALANGPATIHGSDGRPTMPEHVELPALTCVDLTKDKDTPIDVHQICIAADGSWSPGSKRGLKKEMVRGVILDKLPKARRGPVFPINESVRMKVWFLIQRPNEHFKGNCRATKILRRPAKTKVFAPTKLHFKSADFDSMLNCVLDACSGCLYEHVCQVVQIEVHKQWDNHGLCKGGTLIQVSKCTGPPALPNNYRG